MSFDINSLTIIGRLTKDPESGFTQTQKQYTKFSIANNQGKKGDQDAVSFFDCVAWAKTAELCQQYIKKGSQVCIIGRLSQSRFTDKNGQNRSKVEIICNNVQFLGGKNEQNNQPQQGFNQTANPPQGYPQPPQSAASYPAPPPLNQYQNPEGGFPGGASDDQDIPF